jgi:exonuclease III/ribonuclease HI
MDTPFKIVTQNIQGLNLPSEQQQVLSFMKINNINILGLSETKLQDKKAKCIYKNNKHYKAFFNNNSNNINGSGVGIIIDNNYSRYIQNKGGFKGRVIYLDMFLKGHIKIRIIQIYLQANFTGTRNEIQDIHRYIINLIETAHKKNTKVILMGDFNVNPEKYKKAYRINGSFQWKYNILHELKNNNMVDMVDLYNDITEDKTYATYIPKQLDYSQSRIDMIYVSRDLISDTLTSNNISNLFNTDHLAVYLTITKNLFKYKSMADLKQHKIKKRVFTYDNMTKEKWEKYTNLTNEICKLNKLQDLHISDTCDLDYWWSHIKYYIMKAAIATIDNHMKTDNGTKSKYPKHILEIQEDLRFTNKFLKKISYNRINRLSITKIQAAWSYLSRNMETIINKHKYQLEIPNEATMNNIIQIRNNIREFHKTLKKKYDLTYKQYEDKLIKEFVQKRCENLQTNKGHMIASFLEKEQRRIIIDRLIDYDDNGNQVLVTDPEKIKEITNHHFQTCAGGINEEKLIPDRWINQYTPKNNIDENIYNSLMDEPTIQEWNEVLKQLPSDKAAGPSKITNEMLKHLGDKMNSVLWKFVCACFKLNDIPKEWKKANVYPIPKPKEWECQLNNTRPITLLDTTRKTMIRILNNRLAKIMVNNKVLKGNQFAGLPGTSTFEPIRIVNEIIQDAKERKKEIWVLFQDLSKAYDRVNVLMLEKAMERLKLPQSFISLITNIFTNRKNQIFTEVGITQPYDVLVGIDQGEVLSPLLWCIYYDPLLCEINEREIGYNLMHTYKTNVLLSNKDKQVEENISNVAFMDDTTWITEDKEDLEKILEIADDFYNLNNIKVNKDKSELLYHQSNDRNEDELVILQFGQDNIEIKSAKYKESIRFLGVWINLAGHREFIINQTTDEVTHFCHIINNKRITDKQLLYLWNMVVIPRIEYRTQITYLGFEDCNKITSFFRKFFKHKLNLSLTAPNALMENRYIYNFRDIFEVQKQSKITNFFIQLNDKGLLGRITNIRLRQLQSQEWLISSPLIEWHQTNVKTSQDKKRFIAAMITLCKQNNFTFEVKKENKNTIRGGKISLYSVLGFTWNTIKKQLRNMSIIFLDQLTTLDGKSLLHWKDIMRKEFIDKQSFKTPFWFYQLSDKVFLNYESNNRLIKEEYRIEATNLKGNKLTFPLLNDIKKDWIVIWNFIINRPIYGKIIKKNKRDNTIVIAHWIAQDDQLISTYPIIHECKGCNINNPDFNLVTNTTGEHIYKCTNLYTATDAIKIVCSKSKKISDTEYLIETPLFEADAWAQYHMEFFYKKRPFLDINIDNTSDINNLPNIDSNNLLIKFTERGPIQKELYLIQSQLTDEKELHFYTDGSVIDLGKESMSMSFALIQTHPRAPSVNFKALLENWPSSTRAETAAIATSLLLVPKNCYVKIFLDSQAAINHFYNNLMINSPREFFKENNNLIWEIIREVIKCNNLFVNLVKVKAHSGDFYNEQVDKLAKSAHNSLQLPLHFVSNNLTYINVFPKWNNIKIENNLRDFITKISWNNGIESWLKLYRNKKYVYQHIDWNTSFLALNDNEISSQSSFVFSARKSHRIKFMIEELATVEHIKKRRPDLYNNWLCPRCNRNKEDFNHVFTCDEIIESMKYISYIYKEDLKSIIEDAVLNTVYNSKIIINDNLYWIPTVDNNQLTFIDLIKGIIPMDLFENVNTFIRSESITRDILCVFIHRLQNTIKDIIWLPRCELILQKEQLAGILPQDKKQRKKNVRGITRYNNYNPPDFNNYSLMLEIQLGNNFLKFLNHS